MDKTYTKKEVSNIVLAYENSNNGTPTGVRANEWLAIRGFDRPISLPKQYSVKDEIERKEREVESKDNTPSLDKVMKAIDKLEDRISMNDKGMHQLQEDIDKLEELTVMNISHITTLQNGILTMLDSIDGLRKVKDKHSLLRRYWWCGL